MTGKIKVTTKMIRTKEWVVSESELEEILIEVARDKMDLDENWKIEVNFEINGHGEYLDHVTITATEEQTNHDG